MHNLKLTLLSPAALAKNLAERSRALRVLGGWTRQTMAERAGVSPASLKRFENTGKGSLELVLKVAHVLGAQTGFQHLFEPPAAQSIAELEQRIGNKPTRKRGWK